MFFFGNAVGNICLLQQGVTHVLLVGQNIVNDGRRPPFHFLGSRDTVLLQFLLDLSQAAAIQIPAVNAADNLRFLRHDLRLAIRALAVAQHFLVLEIYFSRFGAFLLSPCNIFAQRF